MKRERKMGVSARKRRPTRRLRTTIAALASSSASSGLTVMRAMHRADRRKETALM